MNNTKVDNNSEIMVKVHNIYQLILANMVKSIKSIKIESCVMINGGEVVTIDWAVLRNNLVLQWSVMT
jgi:hypothetical protein